MPPKRGGRKKGIHRNVGTERRLSMAGYTAAEIAAMSYEEQGTTLAAWETTSPAREVERRRQQAQAFLTAQREAGETLGVMNPDDGPLDEAAPEYEESPSDGAAEEPEQSPVDSDSAALEAGILDALSSPEEPSPDRENDPAQNDPMEIDDEVQEVPPAQQPPLVYDTRDLIDHLRRLVAESAREEQRDDMNLHQRLTGHLSRPMRLLLWQFSAAVQNFVLSHDVVDVQLDLLAQLQSEIFERLGRLHYLSARHRELLRVMPYWFIRYFIVASEPEALTWFQHHTRYLEWMYRVTLRRFRISEQQLNYARSTEAPVSAHPRHTIHNMINHLHPNHQYSIMRLDANSQERILFADRAIQSQMLDAVLNEFILLHRDLGYLRQELSDVVRQAPLRFQQFVLSLNHEEQVAHLTQRYQDIINEHHRVEGGEAAHDSRVDDARADFQLYTHRLGPRLDEGWPSPVTPPTNPDGSYENSFGRMSQQLPLRTFGMPQQPPIRPAYQPPFDNRYNVPRQQPIQPAHQAHPNNRYNIPQQPARPVAPPPAPFQQGNNPEWLLQQPLRRSASPEAHSNARLAANNRGYASATGLPQQQPQRNTWQYDRAQAYVDHRRAAGSGARNASLSERLAAQRGLHSVTRDFANLYGNHGQGTGSQQQAPPSQQVSPRDLSQQDHFPSRRGFYLPGQNRAPPSQQAPPPQQPPAPAPTTYQEAPRTPQQGQSRTTRDLLSNWDRNEAQDRAERRAASQGYYMEPRETTEK